MKGLRLFILTLAIVCSIPLTAYSEDKVTGSASLGVFNRYIFRGYEIGSDSFVIQPALNIAYKGFGVTYWGNIDSEEHRTQSFIPDREGQKSFNEVDLILSYTYGIDKLSFTVGYIYYNTKYTFETEEIFLTLAYDMILKPSLTLYRDINEYGGTYLNFSVAHTLPIHD